MSAQSLLAALLQNASTLLALVLLFELFGAQLQQRHDILAKLILGGILGLIAIAIMAFPVEFSGARMDTRMVLYSLSGLFIGPVPTLVAMFIGAGYRLALSGAAPWMGVFTILMAGGLGMAVRALSRRSPTDYRWWEFYLFGLSVQGLALAHLLLFSATTIKDLLNPFGLAIVLVLPLTTLALGLLMQHFVRRLLETARRRILVEQSRDGIVVLDDQGAVQEVNHQFAGMLGCDPEEVLNMHIWDWNPWQPREVLLQRLREVDERGAHFETRHMRPDGSTFDVEISTNGSVVGGQKLIFCVCRDITARKRDEEALKLAALVYQNSHEAMMITKANTEIIDINPTFSRITGYERDEVIGRKPDLLRSGRQDKGFYKAMWRELINRGHWEGEIWNRRKNGEAFPQWLSINAVRDAEGEVTRWVAQFTDISEKKNAEQLIWRQANFDALTGLPNRHMFQDRLDHELKQAKRHGHKLALMFLDLDHFKEVNDSLGHDMGDRLLQQAAERLQQCVRESDTIARLGGDEFVIILAEFAENRLLAAVAQKILDALAQPYQMDREIAWISTSIGITLFPEDGTTPEDLLKNADQAMYEAKKLGRNRYHYFTPAMQRKVLERMQIGNDLRQALEARQLHLAYQAIVRLDSGEVARAEALLRWQHPSRGEVPPGLFIPVAEDIGLIHELGDWVFRRVLEQLRECLALRADFQLCLNSSPLQFRGPLQARWLQWLRASGLPGQALVVEITENMLLDSQPWVKEQLHALSDAGMQVAVDDFGTGYSSLSYLRKLHIDFLKIDRSYVKSLAREGEDRVIVEAMINMAHGLGIQVIAEGVESAEQAAILRELRCDFAQGYYFHRPSSAAALLALLESASVPLGEAGK